MHCPFCNNGETRVVDSRLSKDGDTTRRRRWCESCDKRFTTYERFEETLPMVVKKDDRREAFSRQKLMLGIRRACEKRPVSVEKMEAVVDDIVGWAHESGAKELSATQVGERVMIALRELDDVAYVRFASVYRSFKDINEFMHELQDMLVHRHVDDPRGGSKN